MGTSRLMAPHAGEFYQRIADIGCNATELWLLPWLDDDGVFESVAPWQQEPDGRYALTRVNDEYWDLLLSVIAQAHSRGLLMQLCVLDLYGWAASKQGLLWVPNRDHNPVRHNVNGVKWGHPNDDWTYGHPENQQMLPDPTLRAFIAEACRRVPASGIYWRTANEAPQKEMHLRIEAEIRAHRPDAFITTSRNEDTTGQYRNMVINAGFDGLELHGLDHVTYIHEVMPGKVPDTWPECWAEAEPRRVFMSTDGCRNGNTTDVGQSYDYRAIGDVLIDHKRRGFNYSHQSDRKMVPFIEGRFHFEYWDQELAMLARVAAA